MKNINKLLIFTLAIFMVSCGVDSSKQFVISPKQTLDIVLNKKYIVTPEKLADIILLKQKNYQLIDIRNPHKFLVSHVDGAINIPAKDLFDSEYNNIINQDKVINVLYGDSPEQVISYYLLLKQLNYKNIKISLGNYNYIKNNILESYGIHSGNYYDEKPKYNYAKIITEIAGAGSAPVNNAPKKKKTIVKRKKKEVTGGCG